jgi:hypothetical protein
VPLNKVALAVDTESGLSFSPPNLFSIIEPGKSVGDRDSVSFFPFLMSESCLLPMSRYLTMKDLLFTLSEIFLKWTLEGSFLLNTKKKKKKKKKRKELLGLETLSSQTENRKRCLNLGAACSFLNQEFHHYDFQKFSHTLRCAFQRSNS